MKARWGVFLYAILNQRGATGGATEFEQQGGLWVRFPPLVLKDRNIPNKRKGNKDMKTITKNEFQKLLKHGMVKLTDNGVISAKGQPTGFYKTKTNRYIEDKYADMARKL